MIFKRPINSSQNAFNSYNQIENPSNSSNTFWKGEMMRDLWNSNITIDHQLKLILYDQLQTIQDFMNFTDFISDGLNYDWTENDCTVIVSKIKRIGLAPALSLLQTVLPKWKEEWCHIWFPTIFTISLKGPDSDVALMILNGYFLQDQQRSVATQSILSLIGIHTGLVGQCIAPHTDNTNHRVEDGSALESLSILFLAYGQRLHKTTHLTTLLSYIEKSFNSSNPNARKAAFKCWRRLVWNHTIQDQYLHTTRIESLLIPILNGILHETDVTVREECHVTYVYLLRLVSQSKYPSLFTKFVAPLRGIQDQSSLDLIASALLILTGSRETPKVESPSFMIDKDIRKILKSLHSCHLPADWTSRDFQTALPFFKNNKSTDPDTLATLSSFWKILVTYTQRSWSLQRGNVDDVVSLMDIDQASPQFANYVMDICTLVPRFETDLDQKILRAMVGGLQTVLKAMMISTRPYILVSQTLSTYRAHLIDVPLPAPPAKEIVLASTPPVKCPKISTPGKTPHRRLKGGINSIVSLERSKRSRVDVASPTPDVGPVVSKRRRDDEIYVVPMVSVVPGGSGDPAVVDEFGWRRCVDKIKTRMVGMKREELVRVQREVFEISGVVGGLAAEIFERLERDWI